MNNTQTVEKIEGSVTSVALIDDNGNGQVTTLQNLSNQLKTAQNTVTRVGAFKVQIEALGLTFPTSTISS